MIRCPGTRLQLSKKDFAQYEEELAEQIRLLNSIPKTIPKITSDKKEDETDKDGTSKTSEKERPKLSDNSQFDNLLLISESILDNFSVVQ
ncbi:hypothetical protein SNEBB_003561 [Seison nebaliae]|nr:hypothetical protein SNEBB_003561 [Seison nebaliae]